MTGEASAPIWADEAGDPAHPLIALVHGSMDRGAGLLKVSRRLDHRYRVLRYDRRGYGRSTPHAGPFGMEQQVADLVGLLAGRQAVLVAHSYGGNVALAAAARHPELVVAVALYETPLSWMPWWPGSTAGGGAIATAHNPEAAAELFMRRMIGDARWEALPERTRATRLAEGRTMVGELRDLRAHEPWTPDRLRLPVAVGYGTRGQAHHHRGMQHTASVVRGARLVALEGCGHAAPSTHPDLFCDELVRPLLALAPEPWASAAAPAVDGAAAGSC